jgi:putative tricarboxylic transport membrane protein
MAVSNPDTRTEFGQEEKEVRVFRFTGPLVALLIIMGSMLGLIGCSAGGAAYPEKTITLVVANNAASVQDLVARELARSVEKSLKVSMPVENRPGGDSVVGWTYVKSQPADGYTLVLLNVDGYAQKAGQADSTINVDDFQCIGLVQSAPAILAVKGDGPYKTLADLTKAAAAQPGKITVGGSGSGGSNALLAKYYSDSAKVQTKYVPFTGGNESIVAVLGGHVDSLAGAVSLVMPMLADGKLKVLGVASEKRDPNLPDVPTFKEQGVDVTITQQQAIMVRKGTPADRIQVLKNAFKAATESEDYKKYAKQTAFDGTWVDGKDIDADMAARVDRQKKALAALQ